MTRQSKKVRKAREFKAWGFISESGGCIAARADSKRQFVRALDTMGVFVVGDVVRVKIIEVLPTKRKKK